MGREVGGDDMFKFKTPQRIFQIGKVKIGGQPGELPKVLIGTIFYEKHEIVKDPKKGTFDREKAAELIKKQDELSDLTGNPCMLDVVCTSVESGLKYIDFVASATDAPISVDIMEPQNKPGILKYVGEAGLADRVLYNSIWFPREDEINALKDSGIKAAILLGYNVKNRKADGVISLLKGHGDQKGLLKVAEEIGITKPIVDTTIFTYIPSIGIGAKACYMVKEELGLPVGGAPSNSTTVWKKPRELGLDIHKAVESAAEVVPLVMGCDFLLYGLIESAPWIFPACAAVDAMITANARAELGIKPLTENTPLYKLFPEFVAKLEKADL